MQILVDGDACPAKNEILEVCARHGTQPIFVANAPLPALTGRTDVHMEVTSGGFDSADDWIIAQAGPGDLVLTADLLLAQRAARKGVDAMNFSGQALTDEVIHDLVARREIQQYLREMNLPSHKPVPYIKANRSSLKAALHQWLERQSRRKG
jgi:uncharacterized protein YaiI (UPF0178 family)